jgi:SagB-type dehydrogenase family enzyme
MEIIVEYFPGGQIMTSMDEGRRFLRADDWELWRSLETDQRREIPPPPVEKPYSEGAQLIDLVAPEDLSVGRAPLIDVVRQRRSRRSFTPAPLTLEELSFLLWATQGLSGMRLDLGSGDQGVRRHFRTVPSGGARHPFETYLVIRRVEGLEPGLCRYLPLEHKLYFLGPLAERQALLDAAWDGRRMLEQSAVVFLWTALPYRTEWRYTIVAHKIIAQDSGHLCQNLYLACEAIGAGTCAVGAYTQAAVDALLGVDGEEEFVIYMAPVGKV